MHSIYLDHAAATPVDPRVLTAMQPYLTDQFYNPSALYAAAQDVAARLQQARATVAHYIGARPVEIIFTAGGTEANNLAIQGILRAYSGSKIVVSAIEHDSVLETAQRYNYNVAPVDSTGLVKLDTLKAVIDDKTVLVSIMYANNEIGTIQPLRDIAALLKTIRQDRQRRGISLPLYFHTDAAQATNYLDIHATRLGVDLMTLNGGKIYGPKQSGVLYVRAGITLEPLVYGGGQEHNLRSGTENIAGAIGFAEALTMAQDMRTDESKRLQEIQQHFITGLRSQMPQAIVNGSLKKRLPNNVHITIPDQDNERLLFALDGAGVQAAAGSACSASSDTPSHVLRAIGLSNKDAQASLRFTMGRMTTKADIDETIRQLVAIAAS